MYPSSRRQFLLLGALVGAAAAAAILILPRGRRSAKGSMGQVPCDPSVASKTSVALGSDSPAALGSEAAARPGSDGAEALTPVAALDAATADTDARAAAARVATVPVLEAVAEPTADAEPAAAAEHAARTARVRPTFELAVPAFDGETARLVSPGSAATRVPPRAAAVNASSASVSGIAMATDAPAPALVPVLTRASAPADAAAAAAATAAALAEQLEADALFAASLVGQLSPRAAGPPVVTGDLAGLVHDGAAHGDRDGGWPVSPAAGQIYMPEIGMNVSLDGYLGILELLHELVDTAVDGRTDAPLLGFSATPVALASTAELDYESVALPMHGDFVAGLLTEPQRELLAAGLGPKNDGVPELGGVRLLGRLARSDAQTPRTVRSSGATQLGVLHQAEDGLCGHYALYNALCALALCGARSAEERRAALARFTNRVLFWQFYKLNLAELARRVELERALAFPWRSVDVRGGQLERAHLAHLVAEHPIARLVGSDRISVLPSLNAQELANGSMSAHELDRIQAVFASFQTAETVAHAFVCGAHAHWVAVLAHKRAGRIEVLFLDSQNTDILGASDEYVGKVLSGRSAEIDAKVAQLEAAGGLEHNDLQWIHTLRAMRSAVELVTECVNGFADLRTRALDLVVEVVVSRFLRVVGQADSLDAMRVLLGGASGAPAEGVLAALVSYLQSWEPPAALRASLVAFVRAVGPEHMSLDSRTALLSWTGMLLGVPAIVDAPIPETALFVDVLREIAALVVSEPAGPSAHGVS